MKTVIKTVLCAAAAILAAVSCQKSIEPVNPTDEGKKTIDISVSGLMGEYTQADATKADLVNTVRVSWKGGETVYVYDGTQYLGSLVASLEDDEDRYALLSTDDTHKVEAPAEGTEKLTLVYSPLLTKAPAFSNGGISISLANQNSAKAPFVAYATLDYNNETTITNAVVPFKFASSVIKINCTGLKANTAITSATVSGVNTVCKLVISGTDAPSINGDRIGTITRTGDTSFSAGSVNAEGEAVFQIAVPVLGASAEARVLTITQDGSKVEDIRFTTKSLNASTSVNTVCQMTDRQDISGVFSVSSTKKVRFSKGNLIATIDASGAPTAWRFATRQYDYIGQGGANMTIGTHAGDMDLFGWSTEKTHYGISASEESKDYYGTFIEWGTAIDNNGTWFTLSSEEWKYLLALVSSTERNGKWKEKVKVCNRECCLVLLPDNWTWGGSVGSGWQTEYSETTSVKWSTMEAAGAVCLPPAGIRHGNKPVTIIDIDHVNDYNEDLICGYEVPNSGVELRHFYYGYYWSSSPDVPQNIDLAMRITFNNYRTGITLAHDYRRNGLSVRLVTEVK